MKQRNNQLESSSKCHECGTTEDRIDTDYGAVYIPVKLNHEGLCAGCAYKKRISA